MEYLDINFLRIAEMYASLKLKTCKSFRQMKKEARRVLEVNEGGHKYIRGKRSVLAEETRELRESEALQRLE